MKKSLLLLSLLLIFFAAQSQTQSIPYCDNFNGATLWTVTTVSGSAWQQGSPSYGLTNSTHTPPNCFDVELAAAYLPNTIAYLNSPAINFTSAPNAKLSFWQNRNTEVNWDGMRVEYSTDSGTTWIVLGTVADPNATNWYNALTIGSSGLSAWDGTSGGWIKSTYNLNFLSGTPSVMFRFVFTSDPTIEVDGFSIDDFCITLPPNTDIGVDSILSPQSFNSTGASVPVQVRLHNYGLLAASNFNVYYKVDNGVAIGPANYAGSVAPAASVNVTCANLTIPAGTHILSAYAVITNDGDYFNDTTVASIAGISNYTLPYYDNFDSANVAWIATGANPSTLWELGTPNFGATSSSYSAPNSWDINLNTAYGNNALAYLTSPFFDFTTTLNAKLKFFTNYNTEVNWDGVRCEYRAVDTTWHVLGAVGSPGATNWYTNTINSSGGLPAWEGNSLGWKQSEYDSLNMLNGAADVQFRFVFTSDGVVVVDGFSLDNFEIKLPMPLDIGVDLMVSPTATVSAGASLPVQVRVSNFGLLGASNFNVFYKMDNGAAVGPANYGGTLAINTNVLITCANLTVPVGAHTLVAYTSLTGDGDANNDTLTSVIVGVSTVTLPYFDNFDGADAGWYIDAANSATVWQLGSPTYGATNTSYSAPNCWDINLNSGYQSSALCTLTSPFIDFTNAVDAKLKFNVNYNTEQNIDGVRCEYRANDSTWHVLGNLGSSGSTNWYTNANLFSSSMPGWAGNSIGWKQCEYDSLNMLSGAADVQFRFVFTSDPSITLDGFSIDNFEVTIPLSNSAATQAINTNNILLSPSSQYYQALVVNRGLTALSNASVSLKVDSSTVITETATFSPPLNYNESRWYIFTTPWNAAPGAHNVCTYTSNPNGTTDLYNYDDTTCYAYTVLDSASVFPYCNDFENSAIWPAYNPQTWAVDNLWQAGTPSKSIINNAHSGVKCWVTDLFNGYGANKSSALISPVFYVQQWHCYRLVFWHLFNTEYLKDGGTVEYSTDNGATWDAFGMAGNSDWFNTNYVEAFGNPPVVSGWTGTQATWSISQHDIFIQNNGEYIFRFRFGSNANNNGYDGWAIDDLCFEDLGLWSCPLGIEDNNTNFFSLSQNEPNPANETTTIHFNLINKKAQLRITDVLGNKIFEKEVEGAQLTIDLKNYRQGIYFYELQCGENKLVKKMTVVR